MPLALCAVLACGGLLAAEDWTLGATRFSVESGASSAERRAAEDIPRLILEKIGGEPSHILSGQELADRGLYDLQTGRLSLFLQLSREVKVRDSLVLSGAKPAKLRKQLAAAEEKIRGIEEQIAGNLAEAERKKAESDAAGDGRSSLAESVVLYRGDEQVLYEPAEAVVFAQDVAAKKISGLISGSMVAYGGYAAVTAELTLYPGGRTAGSVTEVGALADVTDIADNLARGLLPLIVNTIPVRLFFDIQPEAAAAGARIFIDGVLQPEGETAVQTSSGLHTVEVDSEGYFSQKITYRFSESPDYRVRVPLEKIRDGTFTVTIGEAPAGSSYLNGSLLGYIEESSDTSIVTINGRSVIGQFVTTADTGEAQDFFYYIPPDVQQPDARLGVTARLRATDAEINGRRVWMYRGYSAFMLSLPLAMLSYGKYLTTRNGYNLGAENPDAVDNWARMTQIAAGLTVVSGGFFIFELVRYLHAASSMLPQEAYAIPADEGGN